VLGIQPPNDLRSCGVGWSMTEWDNKLWSDIHEVPEISHWDEMIAFLRDVVQGKRNFWDGSVMIRGEDVVHFALALETLDAQSLHQLCLCCDEPAPHTMMVELDEDHYGFPYACAWCVDEMEAQLTTQTLPENPGKGRQV
jgi:hypothetical protein